MDHFLYRQGILHAEEVPLPAIAEEVGTPFYCYSTATLERHFQIFEEALAGLDHLIYYAVKANSNLAVLATLGRLGAGADVVSEGEIRRALAAGIPPQRIVFSGVGKTGEEMRFALKVGVRQFNVESAPELYLLSRIASAMGVTAPIALRVNPDVDARTHEKISTGRAENKFGIPYAEAEALYREAARLPGIEIVGVDMHIGSQLTDLAPFEEAYTLMRQLVERLDAAGIPIRRLDLGGGLGVPYVEHDNTRPPLPIEYGAMVKRVFAGMEDREFAIEPGRLVAANAGVLVSRVIYNKPTGQRHFLIIDAAMNDLIRPSLYEAWHEIIPLREPEPGTKALKTDIVGPVCETGDTFARGREMPQVEDGALIAFRSAGAYGAVMASEYNTRPLIPEVLVKGDQFRIIRHRPTYDEILRRDSIPEWLLRG